MKPKLLIVDDDEEIRSQLKWALLKDYEVILADSRPNALKACHDHDPLVVLLDLGLPPKPNEPDEGLAALAELLAQSAQRKVIIVSGQGEKSNTLKAVGQGAYDFLCKPVDVEELQVILRRAFYVAQLERQYQEMQRHLTPDAFEGMLGTSASMQDVFTRIRKVATTNAPVLILGESGTGKEMAALAIHERSPRKQKPFIAINCGAIPEALLESELFGHEKGSFTGAHMQRRGRIESAEGGTLFLDEVGELPLSLQVKLLRFLQDQSIERVGGRVKIEVNARVIAATNVDLKEAMAKGTFREDLFYRLAVVVLKIPSLRERTEDIHLLAQAFLQKFALENGKKNLRFDAKAVAALQTYPWPGNVRELENRVKRAVIMSEGKSVAPPDLELADVAGLDETPITLKEARETLEKQMLTRALQRHRGNISRAAAELGISRPTCYELMDKLGMRPDKEGTAEEPAAPDAPAA